MDIDNQIIEMFRARGMMIESGSQFSARGQIAQLLDVVRPIIAERDEALEKLDDKERIIKEWQALWMPIDDFVRPLAALGECVSTKALEMIKEHSEIKTKLAAMESQAKQLITKACCNAVEKLTELAPNQGWDTGEVVAEMYIRQLSDKPVPADKPATERKGWYCAHCQRGVDPSEVTYNEAHTVCGRIITDDESPVTADKQERITEQDAREIAISILIEPDADLKTTYIDGWLLAEGITLLNKLNADREQVPVVDAETHTSYCALNTINDDQVRKVVRAFWRRIYPYRNNYGIELPTPMPVEFMAHMATALTWVDKPAPPHSQQSADAVKAFCKDIGLYDPAYDDQGYIEVSRHKLREHVESLYDRCPSHESEQPDPDSEGE